jgi:hypothetical protein
MSTTTETFKFVPIATRPRDCGRKKPDGGKIDLLWTDLEGAPMTQAQAWAALEADKITMTTRHEPDQCVLLIKPKVPEPTKPEKPQWRRSPIRR